MKTKLRYFLFISILLLLITGCSNLSKEEYADIMSGHPIRVGETVNHAEDSIVNMYVVVPDSYREENAKTFKDNMKIYVKEIKKLQGKEPEEFKDFHELYLKSMLNYQRSIDLYYDAVNKDSYSLSTDDFEEIIKYHDIGEEFMAMALDELSYID